MPDPKESGVMNRDGEFNAMLNFIATVNEVSVRFRFL